MDASDFQYSNDEIKELVKRFRESAAGDVQAYFEPDELEAVIDYFLQHNHISESKDAIQYALKLYPGNENIQVLQVHYLVLDDQMESAEKSARNLLRQYPDNIDLFLVLASILSDKARHHEAVELLEKALDIDHESEPVITALSMEYQILGQHSKAIGLYMKLLEQFPDDEFALNELIFVFEVAGKMDEAIAFLTDFTDRYPFNQYAWFHLANVYNLNSDPTRAIEAYDFALAIDSGFLPALFGKGHSLLYSGDIQGAVACFKETSQSESFRPASYYSLGEAFTQMNNYGSAAEYYNKSIEVDPEYNEARIGLANSLYMLGLDAEALRHIDLAIVSDPERADSYHLKGTILMNLERYNEAIDEYRHVLKIDKDSEAAWLDLSEACHFLHGADEALEILVEAESRMEQDHALIAYRRAAILFETGRNQEAVSQLLNGLTLNFDLYPSVFDYNKSLENNEIISEIVSLFLNQ